MFYTKHMSKEIRNDSLDFHKNITFILIMYGSWGFLKGFLYE